ncbi:hypothetical protein H8959_005572 [Pygathrix nigripes]
MAPSQAPFQLAVSPRTAGKLSKEYGSVYTVHLGSRRVVVLSGYLAMKEALVDQGEEFSGHGDYPVFQLYQGQCCFHYDDERLLTIIRLINDSFQIMSGPWGEASQLSPAGTGCGFRRT